MSDRPAKRFQFSNDEITSVPIEVVSIGVDVMRWFESEEFSEWYESLPIAEPCEMVLARVL